MKINYKKGILFTAMVICICLLKAVYVKNSIYMSSEELVHTILVFWGDHQLVNVIWLLPMIMNLLFVSKTFYLKTVHFNTRYKNRANFISNLLKHHLLYALAYNLLVALMQIVVLAMMLKVNIQFSFKILELVISYSIEYTMLNFIVLALALYSHRYVYSLLVVMIVCVLSLMLFKNNAYMPFVGLYGSYKINLITVVLLMGLMVIIQKKYLKMDLIGGYEHEFRN